MIKQIFDGFIRAFGGPVGGLRFFFAPGRVNIIGEHIDYNGGFVFPCALTLGTYAAVRRRDDNVIRFASADFEPIVSVGTGKLEFDQLHGWANYPKGTAFCITETGHMLGGFDMFFCGDLPTGAGLSSSASVTMVTAAALDEIFSLKIGPIERAKLCRRAEHYNGVSCGIMDQFASAMGRENHAILLDCNTLDYRLVPFDPGDLRIVVSNTNKRRELADSKYNERLSECESALADLKKIMDITALCDLSPEDFEKHKHFIKNEIPRKRAEHAVCENARTKKAAEYVSTGNLEGFAQMIWQSHESLANLYEVSCFELDTLVNAACEFGAGSSSVYGSRMTGAGFGGCTVSFVHKNFIDGFKKYVGEAYEQKTKLKADFYIASPGEGAREI